jgi:hypothetical protein
MRGAMLVVLMLAGVAAGRPPPNETFTPSGTGSAASRAGGSGQRNATQPGRVTPGHPVVRDSSTDTITIVLAVVCIVGLIIVAVWISSRTAKQPSAGVQIDETARKKGLEALRGEDAQLDEAVLAERARQLLLDMDAAWTAGSMKPVRRRLADGLYTRFQTQLALLRQENMRNVVVEPRVESAEIATVTSDAHWDALHVKMVAASREVDVPADTSESDASKKAGEAPSTRYEEVFTFLRRRGVRTKKSSSDGAMKADGTCANCGSPLPANDAMRCDNCQVPINSGEHDWVLAGIEQPEEWRADGGRDPEELNALRTRDPALSRRELENRAAVLFWKWLEARVTGDRDRLERFCLSVGRPDAPKAKLTQIAVGSIDVVLASPAEVATGIDGVEVEVRWSASVDGAAPRGMVHRVVLARSAEAQSRRGLSCLDCSSCGGALDDSEAVVCPHCQEPLTGGRHDWALSSVVEVVG